VSDRSHQLAESGNIAPATGRRDKRRWQVGLRTLFLLMAVLAVWMAYFINRRHNAALEARVRAMMPLAHELIIEDAQKVAVVKLEEYWFDENRWHIYLPAGRYRVCLATRDVEDMGLAPRVKSAPIAAGRHELALEQQRDKDAWRLAVTCDGAALLSAEEPREWNSDRGSMGGGQFALSEQLPPEKPVVLFRRRFMRSDAKGLTTSPTGPSEGILLWIEPAPVTDAKR
jgi:hypothetical protein